MNEFRPTVGNICHFPPPPGGMPVQAEALTNKLRSAGIPVIPIPTNLRGNKILRTIDSIRFLRSFARLPVFLVRLLAALPRVNVLHVHCCSGLSFFLFATPALVLGRLFGRRGILHYHGGNARAFFEAWRFVIPWIIRRADAIVVPSEYLWHVFREFGFDAVIIRNICDLERFESGSRDEYGPVFVAARNLEPVYNISCLIRAFALVREQYPDALLYVLGGGSEEGKLKALTARLGLSDAIQFLGYVTNEEIPRVFRNASIFLNSSISDNQPVSILEAYAAGLPVVTSRAGGIPFLVEHGKTGLLCEIDDYRDMAGKILLLLRDPELARTLTANARAAVQQHAWPHVFDQLMKVYRRPDMEHGSAIRDPRHSEL